jgi:inner membrane protein
VASAITHFVVGAAFGLPAMESTALRGVMPRWAVPVAAGLFAVAPDLDTWVMQAFGIPHGSFFAHRGFFHTPFFLALVALAVAGLSTCGRRRATFTLAAVLAGAGITHPLLDMLTDGGSGVMLLFPFSTERLFFPWRPIRVSPLSIARFFQRAGEILESELPFCAAALAAGLTARAIRRRAGAPRPIPR